MLTALPGAFAFAGGSYVSESRSADSGLIEADFDADQRCDFAIRKEILWESETATNSELSLKEAEYIRAMKSNDRTIGYNRWPRFLG